MLHRAAALAALWYCLPVAVAPARAEPPADAVAPAIEFPVAVERALAARPEFRRFVVQREAQAARREQALLRPPLELGAELENVLGTGDVSGFKQAELTVGLGSTYERGGKRAARVAVAEEALGAIGADERLAVLEVGAETARRFVGLAAAQERSALAERLAMQAQEVVDLVTPRVRAAQSPKSELLNAQIRLADALLAQGDARRAIAAAQARLGEQWADPDAQPRVAMEFYRLPHNVDAAALDPLLEQLPDIARFASEQRVREAEIRLVQAQSTPDWGWFAGVRRLEGIDDQALVLGFSVPLGSAQRALPFVAESRANLALIDGEREAALLRLRTLLRTELTVLESARAAEHAIRDHQLPQAREASQLTLAAYRVGRYPYRELALAQQQVIEFERRRLDAAIAYHLARVELERLIGSTLPTAPEPAAH